MHHLCYLNGKNRGLRMGGFIFLPFFQEELVINGAAMNIELYGIESQILKLLSESEGNILDNTALIETLAEAKAC